MLTDFTYTGRRRALDRAMDAALKNPTKRRRRAGEVVRSPSKTPYISINVP